jgi:ABC-type transport system involved in multi-copper enzyme maturation permease subunit
MIRVTLKGVIRDRVFQGIFMASFLFLFIPSISSLSMRQVTELSITLSLSLISFILLLLAVFLGGASLWRDCERRYTFSVLGLPLTRSSYVLGKFAGTALFLLFSTLFLAGVACVVIWYASGIYPPVKPVAWHYLMLAIFYDLLKYVLLISIAFLFSAVSTSFFLPVFGTISLFLVGSASQQVFEFVSSDPGKKLPVMVQAAAKGLYYILPNFSAFDLKLNAIYGIKISPQGLLLTFVYFIVYTSAVLFLGTLVFSRRELK